MRDWTTLVNLTQEGTVSAGPPTKNLGTQTTYVKRWSNAAQFNTGKSPKRKPMASARALVNFHAKRLLRPPRVYQTPSWALTCVPEAASIPQNTVSMGQSCARLRVKAIHCQRRPFESRAEFQHRRAPDPVKIFCASPTVR